MSGLICVDIPRILIAGVRSKIGKTMIAIGLMRALRNRGFVVQPYKVGPDFIDPIYHYYASGRYSRNLDDFMFDPPSLLETFERNFKGADIAVIEGKTGLYDSHNGFDERGSTASVAKIIKSPVVLVADAERMNRSLAAILMGYRVFDRDVNIRGAILNRVGNPRHAEKVKMAAEVLAGFEVLGVIPRRSDIDMPYRHLGLVPAHEREKIDELMDRIAEIVERFVNVERILEIAYSAESLDPVVEDPIFLKEIPRVTVGVIRDKPFCFYYQDNVDAISAKAKVVVIDSTRDRRLPDVDALYIGGGFPEVFAEELERNSKLREEIYEFCDSGAPVYAECGGLMYLGKSIISGKDEYEMVGFLPYKTEMHKRFQGLGYCVYKVLRDNIVSERGDRVIGHEFHYSKLIPIKKLEFAYSVERGWGVDGKRDGVVLKNTMASYIHIHVHSYPKMINRFISSAFEFKLKGLSASHFNRHAPVS